MALTNNQKLYIGCFALIAVFCVITLASINGDFGGSDDAGGGVADEYGYVAWTGDILTIITGDPDYELPGETESMLFAVQAAIGAIIIGYFIGYNAAIGKSAKKSEDDSE
ncbi:MAG: energy-coupling factor ABC transporter substrate-binding protein [Candidatus Methanomethylophilus sp.]|nr:energy-coupling factor ABC transporter substrate-binding protein [Methanomethylophilus sp.]